MKNIKIEWQEGNKWNSKRLPILFNEKGYYYARKSKNKVLMWNSFEKGTPVMIKNTINRKQQEVGRITKYKHIFLGKGKSYTEYLDEKYKENIQGYLKELLLNIED